MFGIGHFWELLMVVAVALLVFGPKRLPEMGNAVGQTIRAFQKSMKEVTSPPSTVAENPPLLVSSGAKDAVDEPTAP
ncbi:MAG: twin-arginine translocase TatA/TatE family subunit [Ktedonobacterales bacterium]|nr:twin-arginine translocase TatA/TatE family subunit [Ktedonobacterales bacterium]